MMNFLIILKYEKMEEEIPLTRRPGSSPPLPDRQSCCNKIWSPS